jgi:hypothetical protein
MVKRASKRIVVPGEPEELEELGEGEELFIQTYSLVTLLCL